MSLRIGQGDRCACLFGVVCIRLHTVFRMHRYGSDQYFVLPWLCVYWKTKNREATCLSKPSFFTSTHTLNGSRPRTFRQGTASHPAHTTLSAGMAIKKVVCRRSSRRAQATSYADW